MRRTEAHGRPGFQGHHSEKEMSGVLMDLDVRVGGNGGGNSEHQEFTWEND